MVYVSNRTDSRSLSRRPSMKLQCSWTLETRPFLANSPAPFANQAISSAFSLCTCDTRSMNSIKFSHRRYMARKKV